MTTFNKYNLSKETMEALETLGYTQPTEVQTKTIQPILAKRDVLIKSQTGSGKTASFGIPLVDSTDWTIRTPQALILTPTRELAMQVRDELSNLGKYKRLNVLSIFGKDSFKLQKRDLAQRTHLVVATPGRLLDHIQQDTIDISGIKMLVIDEADEMLSMGFIDQIEEVIDYLPKGIQTILLSATYPEEIKDLASYILNNPVEITVEAVEDVKLRIRQEVYETTVQDKLNLLKDILVVKNPNFGIIFANTKEVVDTITYTLRDFGASVGKLHGDIDQKDRTETIRQFKKGQFRLLVATDVASRGLDIDDVGLIVNYDMPRQLETYTHRIGRTARLDKEGLAISLVDKNDQYWFDTIELNNYYDVQVMKNPSYNLVNDRLEKFLNKQARVQKPRKLQASAFEKDIMKLHIRGGKNQKMRPGDIVGVITSLPNITAEDIGVIQVLEDSTYVDIHNSKGEYVLKQLKQYPIKGKNRRVQKAKVTHSR